MKFKFAKYMAVLFLAGLVLCGVGAGILFYEISSIEYVKADNAEKNVTDEFTLKLPESGYVYYENITYSKVSNFTITEDNNIPAGEIKYVINHNGEYTDFNTKITNEYYIYDTGNMYISEHRVNYLNPLNYRYIDDGNAMTDFKELMYQIKNKRIIENGEKGYDVKIMVNPADRNRLIELNDNQELITYKDYIDKYKDR